MNMQRAWKAVILLEIERQFLIVQSREESRQSQGNAPGRHRKPEGPGDHPPREPPSQGRGRAPGPPGPDPPLSEIPRCRQQSDLPPQSRSPGGWQPPCLVLDRGSAGAGGRPAVSTAGSSSWGSRERTERSEPGQEFDKQLE